MNNKTGKKRKPFTAYKVISLLMYGISIIAVITIIYSTADIASDYYRVKNEQLGYETQDLYDDFVNQNYYELIKKVQYNEGINKLATSDNSDYYAFAKCYDNAIDYHTYDKLGDTQKASEILTKFKENEAKLNNKLCKEKLLLVKQTYEIP